MHTQEPTVRQLLERRDGVSQSISSNRIFQGWTFSSDALAEKYDTDWLARRIVETWARQGLRRGFLVKNDPEKAIVKQFSALNTTPMQPNGVVMSTLFKSQLYGGAAIYPVTMQGDPLTPLADHEDVISLDIMRRNQLAERKRQTDRNEPDFGQITEYIIAGDHPRAGQVVHASRLLIFAGLPKETRWRFYDPEGPKWPWISALQPVNQAICDFGATWRNVSRLIEEYSVGVIKLKGLIKSMADTQSSVIEDRLAAIARMISTQRKIVLDGSESGEESFSRTTVSFSDIPALMVQYSQLVSGASGIPVTVLMGMSPAGLNATGESDLQQFYDRVQTYRENEIEPNLIRLLRLITKREGIEIEWPSLWEPSEAEKADVRLKNAQGDKIYIDAFAIEPKQVTQARAEDGTLGLDIEPSELAGTPDPGALTPTGTEGAPPTNDVQKTALNGAQLASVLEIAKDYHAGGIPRETAKGIILLGFPDIEPATLELVLGPEDFEPKEEPAAPSPFGPPHAPGAPPVGGPPGAGPKTGPASNGKPASGLPASPKGNARGGNGGAPPVD